MNTLCYKEMKKLVCIVDDETDLADDLMEVLEIPDCVDKKIIGRYDEVKSILDSEVYTRIFFVIDLQLKDKKEGGLEIIKLIEDYDINNRNVIVVYSAHSNLKPKSINFGADVFFHRNPEREANKTTSREINNILHKTIIAEDVYLNEMQLCLSDIWDNNTPIPAKVYDYDNDFVTLNCMIDLEKQIIVEKRFPRNIFSEFKDINIDKSIMLTIKDRPKRICYCFDDENVAEVDKIFYDNSTEFKIDDLDAFNLKEE